MRAMIGPGLGKRTVTGPPQTDHMMANGRPENSRIPVRRMEALTIPGPWTGTGQFGLFKLVGTLGNINAYSISPTSRRPSWSSMY